MKKMFIILPFLLIPFWSSAQTTAPQDLEAYFSAIIVGNIDTSINWYSNVLGFEIINKVESKERGFKQSNLRKGDILIELIELDNAIYPKDVVADYNNKTRFIGFFKTGFSVSNFEQWIEHLTNEEANFYGNIVKDSNTGKKMVIITDPDGNRIQIFDK